MTLFRQWQKMFSPFLDRQGGVKPDAMESPVDRYASCIEADLRVLLTKLNQEANEVAGSGQEPARFEDWREAVRRSDAACTLIRKDDTEIRLVAFSKGFRSLGGLFATLAEGKALNGMLGVDADYQFASLHEVGLFEGAVAGSESIWSTTAGNDRVYLRSASLPVRDDHGEWNVFSHHIPISQAEYEKRLFFAKEIVIDQAGTARARR